MVKFFFFFSAKHPSPISGVITSLFCSIVVTRHAVLKMRLNVCSSKMLSKIRVHWDFFPRSFAFLIGEWDNFVVIQELLLVYRWGPTGRNSTPACWTASRRLTEQRDTLACTEALQVSRQIIFTCPSFCNVLRRNHAFLFKIAVLVT